ncbi:DUF6249 domain-containing protein [Parabacteroides bouchesdurhonensis]|uniref:DUF6249 domain-containing protein n=1 Tax=Parabacteroides bouchesdurhonensis TaxID=1936995 RepID=UPI000C84FEE1|nr:DUF6249 domain-containing protein [Parabacteroides bouchesdurhonensis]RHJ88980.1 hypothetical protein DW095_14255 [Bacteroides sp. AM07-16]
MNELWIPIIAIVCAVGLPVVLGIVACYYTIKGRHEERMAMISNGMILEEPEKKANRYPALRNGMVMIGLAVGLVMSIVFYPYMYLDNGWMNLTIPTMLLLFAGLAFILYFFISRNMQKKEMQEDDNR